MAARDRDLRLDFFRGLGLLFIYLDHIPDNIFSYFTLGNFVFSDAAEIFVFISGYSAALVFGGILAQQGAVYAAVQVLKRCWTLYVAHIFLFVLFVAQVSYTATRFDNPMFLDEMKVADFLQEPHIAVLHALALRLQPPFMDILPLYIVLLLALAVLLPLLRRQPLIVLGFAGLLYVAGAFFHLNLRTYPSGVWYFNPLAWQIVFFIGAALAIRGDALREVLDRPAVIVLSAAFLAACIVMRTAISVPYLYEVMPPWLIEAVWDVADKTNLGPVRLLNFMALVHMTVVLLQRTNPVFTSAWVQPIVQCGQNSLNVFCLGIFLSLLGHFTLSEVSHALSVQFAVSAGGVAIMFATAYFLSWSKQRRSPPREWALATTRPPSASVQGGE